MPALAHFCSIPPITGHISSVMAFHQSNDSTCAKKLLSCSVLLKVEHSSTNGSHYSDQLRARDSKTANQLNMRELCAHCEGSGTHPERNCVRCDGAGKTRQICPHCRGSKDIPCPNHGIYDRCGKCGWDNGFVLCSACDQQGREWITCDGCKGMKSFPPGACVYCNGIGSKEK